MRAADGTETGRMSPDRMREGRADGMKTMILKNWQERALKTFVQAFLGVLIPETVYLLNSAGEPERDGLRGISLMVPPMLCSALAAGLSAVWTLLAERFAAERTDASAVQGEEGEHCGKDA